jgi:hypothetical protein
MYRGGAGRRAARVARSQLAIRLGLAVYAAACAATALRCIALALGLPDTVWTVKTLLSLSSPLVRPLLLVPGSTRAVIGSATLADLTVALLLVALPLLLLARRGGG